MPAEPTVRFNIHEAQANLSRLVARVEQGEEIIISRAGKPVAKLVPLTWSADREATGS
jgi:prevent-host-death family protein